KAKPVHLLKEVGDQWQTPPALYWGIFAKFGPFILDLFSDGDNAKCPRYYTVEDNALTQDWAKDLAGGKAYANPPDSRASYEDKQAITGMRNIIAKSIEERDKGAQFVYLIKSATSEVWWPEDADHVCFIRGRISFDLPEWFVPANKTQEASSAGFACAIAIFDKTWRGEHMSYINRDDLLRDGQVMLDMIAAAAQIKVDKQVIKIIEDIKVDINEEIAKAPANSVWPIEVLNIAKEVLRLHGTTVAEINEDRLKEICEEINRQRLEGHSPDSIIDDLFMNMPTEAKSCAA
ncbi:MAG: phage N-6-adenine-methyltransferase, partial [Shewanella sp.]